MFSSFPKKIFLFFLIAIFAFAFSSAKKEGDKNKNIYSEMDRLEEQAVNLEKEKQNLSNLIAFFDTPSYKEREAKEQIGLQNPGEKVIVITRKEEQNIEAPQKIKDAPKSNFRKWIKFIFGE